MEQVFKKLNALDVNGHTERKNNLTYLSWAWAWAEVCKLYPSATYTVKHWNDAPYYYDAEAGYMVETSVTIEGRTLEMWLPVMDNNNRALKAYPYELQYGQRKITVQPATMFEINKAIMRCLVKNLAMFGLGLYIYAGEDLPEIDKEAEQDRLEEIAKAIRTAATVEDLKTIKDSISAEDKAKVHAVFMARFNELKTA